MRNIYQISHGIVEFTEDIDPALYKKNLPAGFYITGFSQGRVLLNETEPLRIPSKIYGDSTDRMNRIINSFNATDKNLGVLLYGESGSGKSLLAKQVCVKLAETHPVIIVSSDHIDILDRYIEKINDSCVFFIDEFEKMFEKPSDQSKLLSIIDGTSSKKNLFVFTANNPKMVNQFFFNRPGRIRYAYEYGHLSESIILEVLEDMLDNKGRVQEIASLISYLKEPSFDVVCSIAREVNLYPDFTVQQLMDGYNSEVYSSELKDTDCALFINGRDFASALGDVFDKYGIKLLYCFPVDAIEVSAIDLKELSISPNAQKTSLNIIDFSLRLYKDGNYAGGNIYGYFDISSMELEAKGRHSTISNLRIADEEIENIATAIESLMRRSEKELPDSAYDDIFTLLSSDDIKLVSKPIVNTKSKGFNNF